MDCSKCLFYTKTFLSKPKCARISNYNIRTRKMALFKIDEAQKICKGSFFEHKDSDLYKTSDDALCDEPKK